jgi:uncharacterized protein (TIGR00369 family)
MSGRIESLIEKSIVGSPLGQLLALRVDSVEPDRVRVRLPFRPEVTTVGDLVHGGAIVSLIDTAATAAAWSRAELDRNPRGTSVGLTVNFLAGGRGQDLVATARVIQRGQTLSVCDVEVEAADGTAIARGLVTYKLSS